MLYHCLDTSHDFFRDLLGVSRLGEKYEEIFLKEYLELDVIDDLYCSSTWLVSDECHLSEE